MRLALALLGATLASIACRGETGPEVPELRADAAIPVGDLLFAELTPEPFRLRPDGFDTAALVRSTVFSPESDFQRTEGHGCELRIGYAHSARRGREAIPWAALASGEVTRGLIATLLEGELECPPPLPEDRPDPSALLIHRVTVRHELPFDDAPPSEADPRDTDRPQAAPLAGALTDALTEALGDLLADLAGRQQTHGRDDAAIALLLAESDHPGALGQAAIEAGQRGLGDTAKDLRRLTADPRSHVARRAGAALGLLKDPDSETLSALARMTEGQDMGRHLVALHALADIGTPEARRYVEALADSHPIPELRELARSRLKGGRDEGPLFDNPLPSND